MSERILRPVSGTAEYPVLVAVWRSAVDATHGFVAPDELDQPAAG